MPSPPVAAAGKCSESWWAGQTGALPQVSHLPNCFYCLTIALSVPEIFPSLFIMAAIKKKECRGGGRI